MARTISWDELRDLAGFQAVKGCAISLYLDLDPSTAPTPGDAHTRLNSLLDEAAKGDGANRRELSHDQRVSLKADFQPAKFPEARGTPFAPNSAPHATALPSPPTNATLPVSTP